MIDFSESKANARLLVERFLETGEQPHFIEFLCFKNFFIEAEFYGYGAEYVVDNFHIYAGIADQMELVEDSTIGNLNKVDHCHCPCDGKDVIKEAKRYDIDFAMINGRLQFIKSQQRENTEQEYDVHGYYSRRVSALAS
tara:strand:+ start:1564 stop:1980 length:417 start_codon:yes stop_codon:yes gene_type:complete